VVAATGVLVGSVGMMDGCVRCYAEATGLQLAAAAAAGSGAAARLLGLEVRWGWGACARVVGEV